MTNTEDIHLEWDERIPESNAQPADNESRVPMLLRQQTKLGKKYTSLMEPLSASDYRKLCRRIPSKPQKSLNNYSSEAYLILSILEREISFSITQWFRKELGIPMPDYYGIYADGYSAIYYTNRKGVEFNHFKKDSKTGQLTWKVPSIGQVNTCTQAYCKATNKYPFEKANASFFWKLGQFVSVRNRISHTSDNIPFTLQELYDLKNALDDFMFAYLPSLHALKIRLRTAVKVEDQNSTTADGAIPAD